MAITPTKAKPSPVGAGVPAVADQHSATGHRCLPAALDDGDADESQAAARRRPAVGEDTRRVEMSLAVRACTYLVSSGLRAWPVCRQGRYDRCRIKGTDHDWYIPHPVRSPLIGVVRHVFSTRRANSETYR